jgi:glutamyl-Q tRNA(Asp) synthetase
MTALPYIGRFAPSPTGPLHVGSLVAALASWWHAKQQHGKWLIRIEDIDPPREIAGAAKHQIACLAAFGMHSDDDILYQSQRSERYEEVLQLLWDADTVFECRCSRSELAKYGGIHRNCVVHPTQSTAAMRLSLPEITLFFDDLIQGQFQQQLKKQVGDVVLKRADGFWAYQLAVVVDDADQGITHIVRGADLLDSTPRQIYLQQLLSYPTPYYAHVPLVLDSRGNKLSKSELSVPVNASSPIPAMQFAWEHLGQAPEVMRRINKVSQFHLHAIEHFQLSRIRRDATQFAKIQDQ